MKLFLMQVGGDRGTAKSGAGNKRRRPPVTRGAAFGSNRRSPTDVETAWSVGGVYTSMRPSR